MSLGNFPRAGDSCPLPPPGETKVDDPRGSVRGQTPQPASQPAQQLLRAARLPACGLELVPRYVLFGQQSLEKMCELAANVEKLGDCALKKSRFLAYFVEEQATMGLPPCRSTWGELNSAALCRWGMCSAVHHTPHLVLLL